MTKRVSELEVELERRGSPRTRLHNPDDPDHYRMPPNGWTCFHCGDTFDHPEDADHLIERRTDGNKHMAGLLNLTSGALDARIKIVITTNLPNVNSVDEALLRKGRTYKQLEFKKLKGTQVNDARMAIGLSPVNIDTENECSSYTLAEALNFEEGDEDLQDITTSRPFGFT